MTIHLSFEEMTEFVFAENIDRAYFRQAARINAHISQCEQCREIYEAVLCAKEKCDAVARLSKRKTGEEKQRIIRPFLER